MSSEPGAMPTSEFPGHRAPPIDLWIVAWRYRGRGKQETFTAKGDATQLVRDLLASDADLIALSRVPVRVTFVVKSIES